ncbi:2'-5' RNA ligase family protein [Halorarum halobium]|uniref:2'-5' RNA ligase family protein n=1 Tax=Halorarum halobium TaxID=3075121 RepID=UPI0028ADF067|nr:2'-5' RNA ligase family protein [Halobaculum sp. XH14]
MFSLNVPVPPAARRIAADVAPELTAFRTVRKRPTIVVKRFGDDRSLNRLREQLRPTLADVRPFAARITGVETFDNPPNGDSPVVYLAVEGEGLRDVHERVVREFGAVEGLEGDEYDPHVTLARGVAEDRDSAEAAVERLRARGLESEPWTVSELGIWTKEYREFSARFPL